MGPVRRISSDGDYTSSKMSTTHVLFSLKSSDTAKHWNEQILKIWDLDSIGIRDDEGSTHQKHNKDIEWKDGRYEVGLPLKENYPAIKANNFVNACCH